MNITSVQHHSIASLITKMKHVTLLQRDPMVTPVYIFKTATIEVVTVLTSDIHPTQFYKLQSSTDNNVLLQKALLQRGIDLFELNGYLTLEIENNQYTLLPPIIEYQKQLTGEELPIIADGFHRVSLARMQGRKEIQVLKIRNIPEEFSYPAYPNRWDEVRLDYVPSDPAQKRKWKFSSDIAYAHYHDFSSAFPNIGKPRPTVKE